MCIRDSQQINQPTEEILTSSVENKVQDEIENEYQMNLNSTPRIKNSEISEKEKPSIESNKITAAGPLQTGSTTMKKVRFMKDPQVFLVESYKKYNQIGNQENCCDCRVF